MSFQFSLWDSDRSSSGFNNFIIDLSILFMRFHRETHSHFYWYTVLSILFMRFFFGGLLAKTQVKTFNSLYEIQILLRDVTRPASYIFQFSLWDSKNMKKIPMMTTKTFNSLYEILNCLHLPPARVEECFQFSLWDSNVK